MSTPHTSLVYYNDAKKALALAHRIDQVKDIRDKAKGLQEYAKQAKDTTLITYATEIKMRAERRAGELLIEMDKNKGARSQLKGRDGSGGRLKRPPEDRTPKLSDLGINKTQSSRWQKLAALDRDHFEAKVESASERAYNRMTYRFVKEAANEDAKARHAKLIEGGCVVADLVALADTGKRFGVVYADPPWPWKTWGGDSGKVRSAPDNHYGTNPLDEIMSLPVAALAAEDCALLMWCTWPHILIGTHIKIIEAWGFTPCTVGFDWIKQNPSGDGLHTGMGYYTRSNAEPCLLAIKGSPVRMATDVHQIVMAPVSEHSAKPQEVRRRIERLFGGPYLELYARASVAGWTTWGNEIKRDRFLPVGEAAE